MYSELRRADVVSCEWSGGGEFSQNMWEILMET